MKFVKYNDNKSVTIPPAVLTVCGLDDEGKLEMACLLYTSRCV